MKPKSIMVVAGEASGDQLAAELVGAIRREFHRIESPVSEDLQPLEAGLAPRFFGTGGTRMQAAGVELAFDMTSHAVTGLSDVLKKLVTFRRLLLQLVRLARERQPDLILCVDFSGFNSRFAHAVRRYTRARQDWFHDWHPKIVQYVSPQVWASRAGRAYQMAADLDLLLAIFPFEKDWYAKRVPHLPVEFVGHPIIDRFGKPNPRAELSAEPSSPGSYQIILLPGSRPGELKRHLSVITQAAALIRQSLPQARTRMVFPSEALLNQAKAWGLPAQEEVQVGGLPQVLKTAQLAIASTGTVTVECAYFGVPTIALYQTSWSTYQIGKRIITVKYLAMPNLLAGEELFPEFIQAEATAENLARASIELLRDASRRADIKSKLRVIIDSLGDPGAKERAAKAVVALLR